MLHAVKLNTACADFGQLWWCLTQPNIYFVNDTLLSQMKEVKLVTNKLF